MNINDYSIVYTVVNDTEFFTSNNKTWLVNSLNKLNVDFSKLTPDDLKDVLNNMYFPYLNIYKLYFGNNEHNVDQMQLNRYKDEAKLYYLSRKYTETNELIYNTKEISNLIEIKYDKQLFDTVLYRERQEEQIKEYEQELALIKENIKKLHEQYNAGSEELQQIKNNIYDLKREQQELEQLDIEEAKLKRANELKIIKEENANAIELMRNEMTTKKKLYDEYMQKYSLDTISLNKEHARLTDKIIEEQKRLQELQNTITDYTSLIMYKDLQKFFNNKLSFMAIREHKEEILNILNK